MTEILDESKVAAVTNMEIEKMGENGKIFTTAAHVEEARV